MTQNLTSESLGLGGGLVIGAAIGFLIAWFWRGTTAAARPWDLVERRTVSVVRHLFEVIQNLATRLRGLSERLQANAAEQRRTGAATPAMTHWLGEELRAMADYLASSSTQLDQQLDSLRSQSQLLQADVSTGLANREAFAALVKQRLTIAPCDTRPTSLAILEIDAYGQIVAQFGRKIAERITGQIAEVLVETLRAKDAIARVDDHQFALLLCETRLTEAQLAADRLRRVVTTRVTQVDKRTIAPTISLGLAGAMKSDSASTLFERAQQCVELARVAGGNRVFVHDGTCSEQLDESQLAVSRGETLDLQALPPTDMLAPQLVMLGTDPATGLPNRQTLLDSLRETYVQCTRGAGTMSLMLVAIDELPEVHRQHGAQTGDALLRVVTQLIRSTTRASFDHLGLYEHDTIGVLLVGAALSDALRGAERLQRALVHCRLRDAGHDISLTSTIGVAQLPAGGDSLALQDAAARALDLARREQAGIGYVDATGIRIRGRELVGV